MTRIAWPEGKDFAFTIFDDTDYATLENVRPVYSLLRDLGFRTTKSVWPIRGEPAPCINGETCDSPRYLEWVRSLQSDGFEIALHTVTYNSSVRENTIRGIEAFRKLFGHYPVCFSNHVRNQEAVYWGPDRLSGGRRVLYHALTRGRNRSVSQGHDPNSSFFWGDVCRDKIRYVRNFTFGDINTLKACPLMPYHDPKRPYVNYWFASSEGSGITEFVNMISEPNQDKLERESGACIIYTHFARGFSRYGELNADFVSLVTKLSQRNGWFVPVGTLLDYLRKQQGPRELPSWERMRMETQWLGHKIVNGVAAL
ncbi:MAG TPA: hypothetical protein VMH22_09500 [bacterium]|nr:hypothetical protein [bacterium]